MRTSETIGKVSAALVKAQAECELVAKGGRNEFDKYDYAKFDDYQKAASKALRENKLAVLNSAIEVEQLPIRKTSKGNDEHVARVKISLRIVHESGEWIEIDSFGDGQDRGDKGVYKALTGARKYGYAMLLGLATTDDAESDDPAKEPAPLRTAPANRPTAPRPNGREFTPREVAAHAVRVYSACGEAPADWKAACDEVAMARLERKFSELDDAGYTRLAQEIEKAATGRVEYDTFVGKEIAQ